MSLNMIEHNLLQHEASLQSKETVELAKSALHFEKGEQYMWVFGYGSLIWNAGFEYTSKSKASITGFARRFWHGNSTFRGTPQQVKITIVRYILFKVYIYSQAEL
jgi:hypothetical protein